MTNRRIARKAREKMEAGSVDLAKRVPARLALEDGTIYEGFSIGAEGTAFGEIVFNTSATGYQEILTDPSYRGQVVMMTYPEIGNYGVNPEDYESQAIHAAGFVVKRLSSVSSSWRAEITLQEFLARNGIVGIEGVDTRAITRKIRELGTMKVGITTESLDDETFLLRIRTQLELSQQDLVGRVTTPQAYTIRNEDGFISDKVLDRLVVVDFGVKRNILDSLSGFVEEITVLPAHSTFELIASYNPQGVLLSNGPGDPTVLTGAIEMARQLVASGIPTFGICLGHQILGVACGATAAKMRFGHHGGNHPVKDLETGQISITSQNHGYAVEFGDFPEETLKVTHVNLNDGTIEGFRHLHAPVFSVQFHPEASPGPHDSRYLFAHFIGHAFDNKSAEPLLI